MTSSLVQGAGRPECTECPRLSRERISHRRSDARDNRHLHNYAGLAALHAASAVASFPGALDIDPRARRERTPAALARRRREPDVAAADEWMRTKMENE